VDAGSVRLNLHEGFWAGWRGCWSRDLVGGQARQPPDPERFAAVRIPRRPQPTDNPVGMLEDLCYATDLGAFFVIIFLVTVNSINPKMCDTG